MPDVFKGIITADGKKRQLPYGNVLETPTSDETLSVQGGFADSKAVGDKFAKVDSETASLKEDISNQAFRDVFEKVNLTFTSGGYYRQEKKFTEAYVEDSGFSYCIVPVTKGEKYICRGIDYYNARACLVWKGDGSTDNTPKE